MLLRMNVPITILGKVSGDCSAQLVPREALVLVGEDVAAVTAEARGEVRICLALAKQTECLRIVRSNVARYVVMHDLSLVAWKSPPQATLKRRARPSIGK